MWKNQEPTVAWLGWPVQGLSCLQPEGLPDSLLALTGVTLEKSWPIEFDSSFRPDTAPPCHGTPHLLPVLEWWQWCRLPSRPPILALARVLVSGRYWGPDLEAFLGLACAGNLILSICLWPGAKQ